MGSEGLQLWSELLWHGPTSEPFRLAPGTTLDPTLDLMFQFQIPYYEQGRRYLHTQSAQEILGGRIILSDDQWQKLIEEGRREVEEGY